MPISTTEEANAYAMRMWDADNDWYKSFSYNIDDFKKVKVDEKDTYQLPVTMIIERTGVGESNLEEYTNGIPDDLDDKDQGKIKIEMIFCIYDLFKEWDGNSYADEELSIEIYSFKNGEMDGGVVLSEDATQHIISRINEGYLISDFFYNKKDIHSKLIEKSKKL